MPKNKKKGEIVGSISITHAALMMAFVEMMENFVPALGLAVQVQRDVLWGKLEKEMGLSPDHAYRMVFPKDLRIEVEDMGPAPKGKGGFGHG